MQSVLRAARYLPAAAAAGVFVAVSMLTRIALALRPDVAIAGAAEWVRALTLGLVFDFSAAAYIALPLVLWLSLPDRTARGRAYGFVTLAGFVAVCFVALVHAVAEWLFWDEFGARFNFIAVDYLLYTQEVLGNIWQSYPVGKILALLAAIAALATALLARRLRRWAESPLGWKHRLAVVAGLSALIAGTAQFVDSDAKNRTGSDAADELAGNGLYEFFSALRRNELSFERFYATLAVDDALAVVGGG
ncbi:MAG TPA: hypothetical protein VGP71_14370, partial [Burkholderiales bacterium]|nr:hypothetical protein [Burkholderiales bacterium]